MNLSDISAQTLPSQLKFSEMTPLGVSARAKKVKFLPQNAGDYTNVNNIIRIPISSSTSFLDPSSTALKFLFTNTSGQTVQFDGSAHSVIQRMRLTSKSGGMDLEDIRNYGQLVNMLSDLQYGNQQRFCKSEQGYGYGGLLSAPYAAQPASNAQTVAQLATSLGLTLGAPGAVTAFTALGAGAGAAANVAIPAIIAQDASAGNSETALGCGEFSMANNGYFTAVLPLLSGLIGAGASKYLPLFLTGDLMLEIELASSYKPYVSASDAANGGFKIQNVELHCQLVEFGGDINSALKAMCDRSGLYLHGKSWRSYFNSINAVQNPSILISERLKSIKSAFLTFSLTQANSQARSMARHHGGVTGLQLKIGSEFYPNSALQGNGSDEKSNSEYILETMKAIGEYCNVSHNSLICSKNFASGDATLASCGRAVYGIDLDAFTKSNIESGVNSVLNNPINVMVTSGGVANLNAYVYLYYDCIFNISPNGSFSVSC